MDSMAMITPLNMKLTDTYIKGSHCLAQNKFQDSRTFQDPNSIFQDHVVVHSNV